MGIARWTRAVALGLPLLLLATACTDSSDTSGDQHAGDDIEIDFEAVGLWDDGPCDESREPLRVGMMTTFESPVLSLRHFVSALEASATAFNARGGANGACIEVVACDDRANADDAVVCVREMDDAGVIATIGDQGTAGQADVSAAMAAAGIPRVAGNVTNDDWGDQNAFPIDASGTGAAFMFPQALLEEGATKQALVRVDVAAASALTSVLGQIYGDRGVTIDADLPLATGTTDYSQYVLAAEDADVDGVILALGDQEAVQVIDAAQQFGSDLLYVRAFSHRATVELGDFADQLVYLSALPPPTTVDVPVYDVVRADLAASDDTALAAENLESGAVRPWVGLYALLWVLRDDGMTEFTREGVTAALRAASDVPMLGIFGDEDWTPDLDHPGLFQRAGTNTWGVYRWDPDAPAPGGLEGNYVLRTEISFDETLCGSPFGGPEPCP